jgi:cell fate regulator YaaT (PSP1 superfamily)
VPLFIDWELTSSAMQNYFVRIGAWGDVARCRAAGGEIYRRGTRVICRTARGLEIGQVTAACREAASGMAPVLETEAALPEPAVATILRATTAEDELLISRLEKHRTEAVVECRKCLAEAGSAAVLLEVDQVFDAGTLIFYFLNPPDESDTELVERLATRYESRVRSGHFAKLLATGCGPGCGEKVCSSDEPSDEETVGNQQKSTSGGRRGGCSGSCAVCVVARARR